MARIGIVGGLGPFAGLDLARKVMSHSQATRDQEYEPVALHSFPGEIPDRTGFLLGEHSENPAPAIASVIRGLITAQARVIGIPCHSAHAPVIWSSILSLAPPAELGYELVSMVEVTLSHLENHHTHRRRVGVLSTTGTYRSETYQNALTARGFESIQVSESTQSRCIQAAIYDLDFGIKRHSTPVTSQACSLLTEGLMELRRSGAEVALLACTELPLAIPEGEFEGMLVLDPTRLLAEALLKRWHSVRLHVVRSQ